MTSSFQKKIAKHTKRQVKTQPEETKQSFKPGSDIAELLQLSEHEFLKKIINNVKAVWGILGNVQ